MQSLQLNATVIVAAYTSDRWELLERAIHSIGSQSTPPIEVIICIDNNDALLERCRQRWSAPIGSAKIPVIVIPDAHSEHLSGRNEHERIHGSRRRFGAGTVRTTATRHASGNIVAFLDDDAEAAENWLDTLMAPYIDPKVVAVGGPPLPRYETSRPPWFPREFDWVFGCEYEGMPKELSPIRHLIGANMSARREHLLSIGGFQSVDFDDMDMCHRLADAFPRMEIIYNPAAIVHHYVPRERVSWAYFWRRCFHVNRQKVRAFVEMGGAANLNSERDFVLKIFTRGIIGNVKALVRGDIYGAVRTFVSCLGIMLAGLGNMMGRIDMQLHKGNR